MYAIILALAAAAATGLMSGFALMKRMTLAGDVMSHIALPGLGLALLWNLNPIIGATVALILGAFLIWSIDRTTILPYETTIGIIFAASLAIGALITPSEELIAALFGGNAPVSGLALLTYLALSAGVIVFLWIQRDRLILCVFNAELARISGVNVERLDLLFLLAFAATLVLGLRFLGALLVGALIILPGAIARQLTHTFSIFLAISIFTSVFSFSFGYYLAQNLNIQTGPTVVLTATSMFFLSLIFKRI